MIPYFIRLFNLKSVLFKNLFFHKWYNYNNKSERRNFMENSITLNEKQNKERLELLRDMLLAHKGKKNAINTFDIAKRLEIRDRDGHPNTRHFVKKCIEKYHLPVVANQSGYYTISEEVELMEYCHNLEARANEILNRKEKIRQYYNENLEEESL